MSLVFYIIYTNLANNVLKSVINRCILVLSYTFSQQFSDSLCLATRRYSYSLLTTTFIRLQYIFTIQGTFLYVVGLLHLLNFIYH